MSPVEHDTLQARAFVDALRGWLGLAPLYKQETESLQVIELVSLADGNKRTWQTPKRGAPQ